MMVALGRKIGEGEIDMDRDIHSQKYPLDIPERYEPYA
jgi:hypothetical protein